MWVNNFFKEQPNCELLNFSWQPLNIITSLAFFFAAYKIYKAENKNLESRMLITLLSLAGIGSLLHHILPNAVTLLFDVIPSLLVIIFGLIIIAKRFNSEMRKEYLLVASIFVIGLLMFFIDLLLCSLFPFGTHFLWHVLAAAAVFKLSKLPGLNTNSPSRIRTWVSSSKGSHT